MNVSKSKTKEPVVLRASIFPALCAVILSLHLCGCKKAAPTAPPPPVVQVMEVVATNAAFNTELIGQLDSPENVEVRARVEAFVDKMLFTEGQEVEKDSRLFQLDEGPYRQRLNAAEGMLAEAEAALKKYQTDVARLTPLFDKKAVPKQDLDNALASVDVGEAGVLSAKARVESAKLDLDYCNVRAPITGLIGAKQVSIGELVGKGQPTLLATISTLDPIWFYCSVGEVDYLRAESEARRLGKQVSNLPVTLILPDGTEHPAKGKFVFIDRAVDVRTGTLRVRAQFDNPEKRLRPGMFARIKVDLGDRAGTVLIPTRAVAELQGKNFVWVVGSDNKTTQRPVKVGQQLGENFVVTEGLRAGERIVVEGLQKVREGAEVNAMTAQQMTQGATEAQPNKQ